VCLKKGLKKELEQLSTKTLHKTHTQVPVFKNRFTTHKIFTKKSLPGELGAALEDLGT
jgi:hypothetical protein